MVRKSTLFPLRFFCVILMIGKCTLFARTFFDEISTGKSSTLFLVKLQSNEKHLMRFSFVSNFKKLTFARLFSLKLSSKSPWCSPVRLKFESYNLQHCKKNCHKLVFCVFPEHLLYHIIFV